MPEQLEAIRAEFKKATKGWPFLAKAGTIGEHHQHYLFEKGYQAASAQLIALRKSHDALVEALERMMPQPLTGNPSVEELVEHWKHEQAMGRGSAPDVLFAYQALSQAKELTK